jgi:hypothetical protein
MYDEKYLLMHTRKIAENNDVKSMMSILFWQIRKQAPSDFSRKQRQGSDVCK